MFNNYLNNYVILKCIDTDNNTFIAKGYLPFVYENMILTLNGDFDDNESPTFFFKNASFKDTQDTRTIKGILSLVPGIGPKSIERIINKYKDDTYRILMNETDKILDVKGVRVGKNTREKLQEIVDIIKMFDIATNSRQLTPKNVVNAIKTARSDSDDKVLERLRYNPYELCKLNNTITPMSIDYIVENSLTIKKKEIVPYRIEAYIAHILRNKNSTYYPTDKMIKSLCRYTKFNKQEVMYYLEELVSLDIVKFTDNHIQLNYIQNMEYTIAKKLNELMKIESIDIDISTYSKKYQNLSLEQQQAVSNVFKYGFSIITGFPGTGKTYIVSTITDICEKLDLNVLLLSTTGKAAQRMQELDENAKSSTIHLALIENKDFDKYDVIIVDESSMMDLTLMYRLINKVNTSRLVFIGDPNQLPPIGFGRPFETLVYSKFPTTHLNKIYRQDSEDIVLLSNYILNNLTEFTRMMINSGGNGIKYVGVSNPEEYVSVIRNLYMAFAKQYGLEYTRDNVVVLTPTLFKYNPSVFNVNKEIALTLNSNRKVRGNTIEFVTGDKVINTENDYVREVMNGETGYIGKRKSIDEIYIKFTDFMVYKLWELSDVQLAYAITVHKSQGSEFNYVIIPLHPQHTGIWDTRMLYTAVSRAKKGVIFVGPDLNTYSYEDLYKIIGTKRFEGLNSFSSILENLEVVI